MDFTLLQPNEIDWKNIVLIGHNRFSPIVDTRQPIVFDTNSKTFIKCTMEPSIKYISCSSLGISLPRMPVKIWNKCGDNPSLPSIAEVHIDDHGRFLNLIAYEHDTMATLPHVTKISDNIAWCSPNVGDIKVHVSEYNNRTFAFMEGMVKDSILLYVHDTPHVQEMDDILTMTSPIFEAEREFIQDVRPTDILRHGLYVTSRYVGRILHKKPHRLQFYIRVPNASKRFFGKVFSIIDDGIGNDFEMREGEGSSNGKLTEVIYVEMNLPSNSENYMKYKTMLGKLAAYLKLCSNDTLIFQRSITLG